MSLQHVAFSWLRSSHLTISRDSILRAAKRSDYTGNDVLSGSKDTSTMAEKKGRRVVIVPTRLELLQFHYITFRNKWTLFVRRHRLKILFQRKRYVCIRWTLKRDCFEHKPVLVITDGGQAIQLKRNLIKGSIPTKDTLVIVLKNSLTALLKIPHDNM